MFNFAFKSKTMKYFTNNILMIEPAAFRYNEQTAVNNYYQKVFDNLSSNSIQQKALFEFNTFVKKLKNVGVNIFLLKDTLKPETPDSIFPNNWVTFHSDARAVLYPMFAQNRRYERRKDVFTLLSNDFFIKEIKDYTAMEEKNQFLEGTGSMVLDRKHRLCYIALSIRSDKNAAIQFCQDFGYEPVFFTANQSLNKERKPIYHTNVMMCLADKFAIICLEAIDSSNERNYVISMLEKSEKEIIEIDNNQKNRFAGNMLQVMGDVPYLVMSTSAFNSLTNHQINKIKTYCSIIHSSLDTIEACGGGSARCMMAEVFLPKKST